MEKPQAVMQALLEETLAQVKAGTVTELFLWTRTKDVETDYEFVAFDINDMLFELGTAILTERIEQPGVDRVPRRN